MFLSSTCRHALRALIHLARNYEQGPVLVRDIAAAADIPHPFLSKILHALKGKGIVQSVKGPGGGFLLTNPPEETTIAQIVEAIDGGTQLGEGCMLGLRECSDAEPCLLHEFWQTARSQYLETINSVTLRDAASAATRK